MVKRVKSNTITYYTQIPATDFKSKDIDITELTGGPINNGNSNIYLNLSKIKYSIHNMSTMKVISLIKTTISDVVRILSSKERLKNLYGVSLYRNAIYLMLNAVVNGLGGVIFWAVAARLYTTENVGIASAAISASGLLVVFSTLGLNSTLVRFLPNSGEQAGKIINSSFTLSGLFSLVLSFIFILGLGFWSPALISIRDTPVFFIMFIIFVPANLFYTLCYAIFISQRRSDLVVLQNIIANLLRFIPLFIFRAFFTDLGVFTSWGLAIFIATAASVLFLIPIIQKGYRPLPSFNKKILGEIMQFSVSNYIVTLLSILPSSILPLLVVNILGAEQNAYFYISWTITSTIASIPTAITTSLFAEGAFDEKMLGDHVKRSLKFICVLLVPIVLAILFLGRWVLFIFGTEYSQNAVTLLRVLTITALPLSINSLYFTIKRVQKSMKTVIIIHAFMSVITLWLSYILLPGIGLLGAGIGWLSANGAAALFIIAIWMRKKTFL